MLFVLDLAFAYVSASPDNETSHSAHFGGYASGVVLGVLMGRNLDEEEAQQHAKTLRGERILQAVLASIGTNMSIVEYRGCGEGDGAFTAKRQ
ncbi:unnamed protein product [Durusdinium trenchii]